MRAERASQGSGLQTGGHGRREWCRPSAESGSVPCAGIRTLFRLTAPIRPPARAVQPRPGGRDLQSARPPGRTPEPGLAFRRRLRRVPPADLHRFREKGPRRSAGSRRSDFPKRLPRLGLLPLRRKGRSRFRWRQRPPHRRPSRSCRRGRSLAGTVGIPSLRRRPSVLSAEGNPPQAPPGTNSWGESWRS